MTAADFRRIALSLKGTEESSHMGAPDFRVAGRIFATLAEKPDVFVPVPGGWGRMGATHIRLAQANEDVLAGALRTAWKLRIERNTKTNSKKRAPQRG